jgi:hypothetical protein
MKRLKRAVSSGILALAGLMASPPAQAAADKKATVTAPAISATDLRNAMRKLWTDHTTYTHSYIVSAVAGLPDLSAVTQRLLRNHSQAVARIKMDWPGRHPGLRRRLRANDDVR